MMWKCLRESEIETALQSIDNLQDRTLVVLPANSGLRPREIGQLNCGSIQVLKSPNVGIGRVQTKRGERDFFVDPVGLGYLEKWLSERQGSPSDPLFIDSQRRRLSSSQIVRRLRRWSLRLGIEALTATGLRNTFLVRLAKFEVGLDILAQLGGYGVPRFRKWHVPISRESIIGKYLGAVASVHRSRC